MLLRQANSQPKRSYRRRTVDAFSAPTSAVAVWDERHGNEGAKGPLRFSFLCVTNRDGKSKAQVAAVQMQFRPSAGAEVKDAVCEGRQEGVCMKVAPADLHQQFSPFFSHPNPEAPWYWGASCSQMQFGQ